jgi:carbon catabolite-derepressing protein kinase
VSHSLQPRNPISPSAIAPNGTDLATNPFDADFGEYYEDEIEYGLDFSMSHPEVNTTFAVLNSSLPEQLPEQHHLTSYASAKRTWPAKEKKQHRTKWHFGIRSRSPPMEVMLEIYRTLKTLGMEWKEKRDLGGLGGIHRDRARGERERARIERNRDYDGCGYVDMRAASAIYFIETRARYQDVVVCACCVIVLFDGRLILDIIGVDEPAALHGGLPELPRGFPPQKDLQSIHGTGCWAVRNGQP